jgi:serine protease Do
VKLTVQRPEGQQTLAVTLGTLPSRGGPADAEAEEGPTGAAGALEGVSVTELTADVRQELQLEPEVRGVVVTRVAPASPAAESGLRRADIITQVNRQPVTTVSAFEQAVGRGGTALLLVHRAGFGSVFVAVEPKK